MTYNFSAIEFSVGDPDLLPTFQTQYAAAADIYCSIPTIIMPGGLELVPTGLFIYRFDTEKWGHTDVYPEIQIRARSGLATRGRLVMPNGIGTIDIDYRDEIKVPLLNLGTQAVTLLYGQRIAQMVLSVGYRHEQLITTGIGRSGGFGSTGDSSRPGTPAE